MIEQTYLHAHRTLSNAIAHLRLHGVALPANIASQWRGDLLVCDGDYEAITTLLDARARTKKAFKNRHRRHTTPAYCPVNDPSCEGGDGDCHDACERP